MMTPEKEHEHGFAFLRKSAIDQHINTRNRWDDLIGVIKKMPDLLGIGLSEGTAIINMKMRKVVKFGTGSVPARGGGPGGFQAPAGERLPKRPLEPSRQRSLQNAP